MYQKRLLDFRLELKKQKEHDTCLYGFKLLQELDNYIIRTPIMSGSAMRERKCEMAVGTTRAYSNTIFMSPQVYRTGEWTSQHSKGSHTDGVVVVRMKTRYNCCCLIGAKFNDMSSLLFCNTDVIYSNDTILFCDRRRLP